jgi:hypothetical protein
VNEEVDKKVEQMKIAEAREEAMRLADSGDTEGAINTMNQKIDEFNCGLYYNDEVISGEITELKGFVSSMANYNTTVRKNMQYSNYQSRKNRKQRN